LAEFVWKGRVDEMTIEERLERLEAKVDKLIELTYAQDEEFAKQDAELDKQTGMLITLTQTEIQHLKQVLDRISGFVCIPQEELFMTNVSANLYSEFLLRMLGGYNE
jgi:hypothetical protein